MKKITAFFLALFPLIVIVLLFVSGLIVKDFNHIFVSSIELSDDTYTFEYENMDDVKGTHQLVARVLPFNATDPTIYYMSTNEDVATVNDSGLISFKDFGETEIWVFARENRNISAMCSVKVTDDKIHRIEIANQAEGSYLGYHESVQLDPRPIPFDELKDGIDPTVEFDPSTDPRLVVTPDGQITAGDEETESDAPIDITYHIKKDEEHGQPQIDGTLSVNIGPGVTSIAFENPGNEIIKEDHYRLFDDIITYPDDDKNRINPNSFEYVISDETVAEMEKDENGTTGVLKFNKPGSVDIDVKFKKNSQLALHKTITSTFKYASDVAFNRYSLTTNINDYDPDSPYIDEKELNCRVYPTDDQKDIRYSVNGDAVRIVNDGGKTRFQPVKTGVATLFAEVDLDDQGTKRIDQCVVRVVDDIDEDNILTDGVVDLSNSYTYPLRNKLNYENLPSKNVQVEWSLVEPSDIAYVNKDLLNGAELLAFHEMPDHAIPIKATITIDSETYTDQFEAACTYNPEVEKVTVSDGRTVVIQAGKKYEFVDVNGVGLGPDQLLLSRKDFYYDDKDNWIIPNHGFSGGMYLYYSNIQVLPDMEINLIVQEDPVDLIANDMYPYYITTKHDIAITPTAIQEIDDGLKPGQIDVYPRTARNVDGTKAFPTFDFQFDTPDTGTVNEEEGVYVVHFAKAGYLDINATVGTNTEHYIIKSTYDKIGKFALQDGSGEIYQSGDTIHLSSESVAAKSIDLTLADTYISEAPEKYTDFFKPEDVSCLTNECTCKVTHAPDESSVSFNVAINEDGDTYGKDTVMIQAGAFVFNLYVEIDEPILIKEFNLFYHGQKLKKGDDEELDANMSYTNSLTLNIEQLPLVSEEHCVATLDGSKNLPITNGTITPLPGDLGVGKHTIKLASDSGFLQNFIFVVKEPGDITDFSIKEAKSNKPEGTNDLFFSCGATHCGMTVQIDDALIDDHFVEQNFDIQLEHPTGRKPKVSNSRITISGIPTATSSNPGYENTVTVTHMKTAGVSKQYKISRDTISRIVLPDHDNAKMSDQKGLQKVHVFGNQSMYNKDEGVVDLYRLPIEIYDFRNKLITDVNLKAAAYQELNVSLASATFTYARPIYDPDHDCINIKFRNEDLYSVEEMYNNAFEHKHRDVYISVSTNSGIAHAEYDFVAVSGVNMYCKEALVENRSIVLQTNVGIEGATKNNITLDFQKKDIWDGKDFYGNGYTFNINNLHEGLTDDYMNYRVSSMFNTVFQGANDNNISRLVTQTRGTKQTETDRAPRLFAYNVYKNFARGFEMYYHEKEARVKNCLFYNNLLTSINVNGGTKQEDTVEAYIENCILFNCSATAVSASDYANIYYKGFFDVYNFRNRDVLKNIAGHDVSFLWDVLIPVFREIGAVQRGADGREYLNAYMAMMKGPVPHFWDQTTGKYVTGEHGLPGANEHMHYWAGVDLGINASLWGSLNQTYDPTAPSYYDEFDDRGNLRWDFMNTQLDKITRPINRLMIVLGY